MNKIIAGEDVTNALTGAAFMSQGMTEPSLTLEVRDKIGTGFIEVVIEMTSYIPFMLKCVANAIENGGEYTGVFDYEVSEEFGVWFRKYMITHSVTPPKHIAEWWLFDEVHNFFFKDK